MLEEKVRWELHKNDACCFEQILESAPYKTPVVRPFTSHLANYRRWIKHAEHCWRSKDECISNVLWILTLDAKPYIHLLCANTGCHLKDLTRVMANRFSLVLWHINHCRLFNAKSSLYIYIKYLWFGLDWFYGISTIVGYLMLNPLYTH